MDQIFVALVDTQEMSHNDLKKCVHFKLYFKCNTN